MESQPDRHAGTASKTDRSQQCGWGSRPRLSAITLFGFVVSVTTGYASHKGCIEAQKTTPISV